MEPPLRPSSARTPRTRQILLPRALGEAASSPRQQALHLQHLCQRGWPVALLDVSQGVGCHTVFAPRPVGRARDTTLGLCATPIYRIAPVQQLGRLISVQTSYQPRTQHQAKQMRPPPARPPPARPPSLRAWSSPRPTSRQEPPLLVVRGRVQQKHAASPRNRPQSAPSATIRSVASTNCSSAGQSDGPSLTPMPVEMPTPRQLR